MANIFTNIISTIKSWIIRPSAVKPTDNQYAFPIPTIYYFKFDIPDMEDGSVVRYSPGWCGRRERCARNEKGLYYNDKERWGIGRAYDTYIPDDVEVLSPDDALKLMGIEVASVSDKAEINFDSSGEVSVDGKVMKLPEPAEEVWFGTKLAERYVPEAEIIEEKEVIKPDEVYIPPPPKEKSNIEPRYCPTCHALTAVITKYADGTIKVEQNGKTVIEGIKTANLVLACPAGHKVRIMFGTTESVKLEVKTEEEIVR
jgi:hypothetical protein